MHVETLGAFENNRVSFSPHFFLSLLSFHLAHSLSLFLPLPPPFCPSFYHLFFTLPIIINRNIPFFFVSFVPPFFFATRFLLSCAWTRNRQETLGRCFSRWIEEKKVIAQYERSSKIKIFEFPFTSITDLVGSSFDYTAKESIFIYYVLKF